MANVNVYLLFDGNCEEAFTFYKSVFNTGFSMLSRFNEVPSTEGQPSVPEQDAEKILHVSLPIGDSVLMGSDGGSNWSQYHKQGNNFSVSVNVEKREEVDRLFNALSENGQIDMPVQDTFWGEYFGMLTDKFGIKWMIGSRQK